MSELLIDFAQFLGVVALIVLPLVGIVIILARCNIIWTIVPQGWFEIVLKWGKFHKILKPGLRLIGVPGVHTLYYRKMSFLKAVVKKDGTIEAEVHEDENIYRFKSTRYPYAFPFKDMEDNKGLHMSGLVTARVRMKKPRRSFFGESDWYASMNMEVMPELRDVIDELSYAETIGGVDDEKETIEKIKQAVSKRLWKAMNTRGDEGLLPEEANKLSAAEKLSPIERLLELCGLEMFSIDLASIDPPLDWRDISLAPYKAEQMAKAAEHQAKASALMFSDTSQALVAWVKSQMDAGYEPTQAQIEAMQEELRARALAKTRSYTHFHGLEGAQTAVIGGGGAAGFIAGGQNSGDEDEE